ncbi:MAG: hypothetical protein BGP04_17610 [Rhizobiales bacterium 62-17]|nr:MAG: hypothetical protein BGP04_17610 [Rhizobiales bacterium 62-17]
MQPAVSHAEAPPSLPGRHGGWTGGWARALKLSLVAVFLFLTGGPAVIAQFDDSNSALYWQRERQRMQQARKPPIVVQRPTQLIRRAAPKRGFSREVPHELQPSRPPTETPHPTENAAPAAPATPGTPSAPATLSAQAPQAATTTIAVIGDNIGQLLAQGLQEAFEERPDIAILRRTRENSGLVRDDYYDWNKNVRELLASNDKIKLAVILIGSNDRQQLRDGNTVLEPRTPKWNAAYTARVEAIATQFRDRKIPLLWVGLPVMKNERLTAELLNFNEIYRDVAAKTGATYIDVWEGFVDDRNQFSIFGPDLNGQIVRLRTGDGVHFTSAGARKLAYYVEGDIRRILDAQKPNEPAVAGRPPSTPSQQQVTVRVDLPPEVPPPNAGLLIPLPPPPPQIVIPVRPPAGPVLTLTAPDLSPGGQLATRARAPRTGDPNDLTQRALVTGAPMDTRPGRADDFSWPRVN